jgi:hypothetical protein
MKGKTELLTNFNFFTIPTMEMLQKKNQSPYNFSFLKIVKIEPANNVQSFFHNEMPSQNITFHIFHFTNWNGMNESFPCRYGPIYIWHNFLLFFLKIFEEVFCAARIALK